MPKNKFGYVALMICIAMLFSGCRYKFGDAFSSDVSIEPESSSEDVSSKPQESSSEQSEDQTTESESEEESEKSGCR